MVRTTAPNQKTRPRPIKNKYAPWSSRACSAWKETNLDSLLTTKTMRGAIHKPTICNMWARMAMVRSSRLGSISVGSIGTGSTGAGSVAPNCIASTMLLRGHETRTRVNPKGPELRLVLQQLPRNHQPLDFARTLADGAQLDVTIKFFRRIVFDKTVPAMNLHAFVGASDGYFAGVELGHGRFQRGLHAGIFHGGRPQGQKLRGLNFGGHVSQLPLDRLKVTDRLAELLALFGILQRRVIGPFGHAQRQRRYRDAAAIQHAHGVDKSVAFFPAQVFSWNDAVFEN